MPPWAMSLKIQVIFIIIFSSIENLQTVIEQVCARKPYVPNFAARFQVSSQNPLKLGLLTPLISHPPPPMLGMATHQYHISISYNTIDFIIIVHYNDNLCTIVLMHNLCIPNGTENITTQFYTHSRQILVELVICFYVLPQVFIVREISTGKEYASSYYGMILHGCISMEYGKCLTDFFMIRVCPL